MYKLMSCETGKVFAQVKLTVLRKLPIKVISESSQVPIIQLVDEILNMKHISSDTDISEKEAQINRLIYKIYNLTEDEIGTIEQSNL